MATNIEFVNGSATSNDNYTGIPHSISIDTSNKQIRIHDGKTKGGFTTGTDYTLTQLTDKTLPTFNQKWGKLSVTAPLTIALTAKDKKAVLEQFVYLESTVSTGSVTFSGATWMGDDLTGFGTAQDKVALVRILYIDAKVYLQLVFKSN